MFLLRLNQLHAEPANHYRVEVEVRDEHGLSHKATSTFDFTLTDDDLRDVQWYMEDYLQYPLEPSPAIATRVEQRLTDIGTELFSKVFRSNDDVMKRWDKLSDHIVDTRIEIITGVREANSIPWELVRDPAADTPLALQAKSFVRANLTPVHDYALPTTTTSDPIRILLVICRPGGRDDVPFRSVASRIIKGLSDDARARFQLDVLRPPTFEQLGKVLRKAKADGQPYHIVHFDGHGLYAEPQPGGVHFSPILFNDNRPGKHGYLAFENPLRENNLEPVCGPDLGKLLVETQTPVLVLNACRSAHADLPLYD